MRKGRILNVEYSGTAARPSNPPGRQSKSDDAGRSCGGRVGALTRDVADTPHLLEENQGSSPLEIFREAYGRAADAFNRHDFETAFSGLPEDVEWHPLPAIPGAHLLRGREAVASWFRGVVLEFPDYRNAGWDVSEISQGIFLAHFKTVATGRTSGLAVAQDGFQVWDLMREPWRIDEYATRDEALAAVGSSDSERLSPP